MDFLGIGPLEIALVALIAFIVLGPDRIPGVMRQLGTWVRQLREMATNITRDYNTDIQQLTGEITALQEEIRSIQRDLSQAATGFLVPPQQTTSRKSEAAIAPASERIASASTEPAEPAKSEASSQPEESDESYSI